MTASTPSARRSAWIRSLAAVSLLAVALPASASADTLLQTINVPVDGSKVASAPLVAGGVYRIVASGTYSQRDTHPGAPNPNPVVRDALYCFDYNDPIVGCSAPDRIRRQHLTVVRYEGDPSFPDLDALDPATTLAYSSLHTYQETFTAPSASRLEAFITYDPYYSYSGGIRLDLYVVSLPPAPAPGGGAPPGGGPPATQVTRRILDPATAWGQAGPATALAPGGEVVAPSPRISPGQREASVTVYGADPTVIAIAAIETQHNCITGFIDAIRNESYGPPVGRLKGQIKGVKYADVNIFYIFALLACLEEWKAADDAIAGRVTAARSSCALRATHVDVDYDRESRTARVRVRRSRRGTSRASRTTPGLIASCRQARNGAVTMRVRTDSRRLTLRRMVGKRIVFGVYRAREASGTAKVRMRFNRR